MIFNFIIFFLFSTANFYILNIECFSRVSHKHRDPVLLISLDGINAGIFDKYLKEHLNSSFNEIIQSGVKAEYMIPIFPTGTYKILL